MMSLDDLPYSANASKAQGFQSSWTDRRRKARENIPRGWASFMRSRTGSEAPLGEQRIPDRNIIKTRNYISSIECLVLRGRSEGKGLTRSPEQHRTARIHGVPCTASDTGRSTLRSPSVSPSTTTPFSKVPRASLADERFELSEGDTALTGPFGVHTAWPSFPPRIG